MIATTEQLDKLPCACCHQAINRADASKPHYPSVTGGRVCYDCESAIKRTPINKWLGSAGQTAVERDYKAFLDGKRNYPISVQITCADGSEILSAISDKSAKAFLTA